MPKLTSAPTTAQLVPAIKLNLHGFPFMVIARRIANDPGLMLYGGTLSCAKTFSEVLSDHPMAVLVQEIEYANAERVKAMTTPTPGIDSLGIVDPDPKRLRTT